MIETSSNEVPYGAEFPEERLNQCDYLQAEAPYSQKRGICGRCGEEYEPYLLLFDDNLACFSLWLAIKDRYGWFCEDCRDILFDTTEDSVQKASDTDRE